jgi:hypothetical protein
VGTVVDFDVLALGAKVEELADEDLIYVLLVVIGKGPDGVMHAARSERLGKLARAALAETCRRFVPDEVVAEAFAKFELDEV